MEKSIINFTKGGNFKNFNKKVIRYLLKNKQKKFLQVTDYIYLLNKSNKTIFEVKDHVNLSGYNPLVGPQFISLTNAYNSKNGIIVAGLKEGIIPNKKEKKMLLKSGIKAYCYNIVPTVILARSIGMKVKAFGKIQT